FMIPLRRHLIVKEHKVLPYPEGTACAEILEAGDEGGAKAKTVFTGLGIGALYKVLMSGFKLWPERFELTPRFFPGSQMGIEATPALMGVGFIIGPKIALLLFSGAVIGYLGIGPMMAFIGQYMTAPLPPAAVPISELSAGDIRNYYIKYIGIGAVAMGGFVSLMRFLPTIISSFKHVAAGMGAGGGVRIRTDEDLPTKLVWGGAFLIALAIWLLPKTEISLLGALLAVLFGFFFVTVSSRMVGIVGSSSLPISGMTIGTLIVVSVILLSSGVTGTVGMVASMMVGSVVCIAVSMAGDASQDLKTGFLVGATPKRQQLAEFLGVLIPALVMGWVIMFLNKTYGFTGPTALEAPQANAMAAVVQGVMTGVLPWAFIITGLILGLSIELLGIHALPVAIGLYLPPELSTPIVVGSLVFWYVSKFSSAEARPPRMEKGILFGSGMVAGDALVGVALSILVGTIASYAAYFTGADKASSAFGAAFGNFFTLSVFLALGLGYLAYVWRAKK
ncbi:MAG: oligopeptide transporter, OPT family, partial [candidate division Zixibacteria bacterium]|nr:oligopeptide transporter, OPT family [candidate division Zixibacteria bacterium]